MGLTLSGIPDAISRLDWNFSMSFGEGMMAVAALMTVIIILKQTKILKKQADNNSKLLKLERYEKVKLVSELLQELYQNLVSVELAVQTMLKIKRLNPVIFALFGNKVYNDIRLIDGYVAHIQDCKIWRNKEVEKFRKTKDIKKFEEVKMKIYKDIEATKHQASITIDRVQNDLISFLLNDDEKQ